MNKMQEVRIEKLTFNVGAGKDTKKLEKGQMLLEHITGIKPIKTTTEKRIATWGLRPGLPIGVKITLRKDVKELIQRICLSKRSTLKKSWFDNNGNISFGIQEYIDIPEVKYNPDIGMMGLQCTITLTRPGHRIKNKKIRSSKIPLKQRIKQEESIAFFEKEFKVKVE
jgi:large subunit ribosomal protein L5